MVFVLGTPQTCFFFFFSFFQFFCWFTVFEFARAASFFHHLLFQLTPFFNQMFLVGQQKARWARLHPAASALSLGLHGCLQRCWAISIGGPPVALMEPPEKWDVWKIISNCQFTLQNSKSEIWSLQNVSSHHIGMVPPIFRLFVMFFLDRGVPSGAHHLSLRLRAGPALSGGSVGGRGGGDRTVERMMVVRFWFFVMLNHVKPWKYRRSEVLFYFFILFPDFPVKMRVLRNWWHQKTDFFSGEAGPRALGRSGSRQAESELSENYFIIHNS